MIIANEFTVTAPIDKAWALLTDLEQVAPLMPGAQLVGREGEEYLGKVKLKVGPVNSEFSGKAHFVERDESQHKALIDARGKESRGTGNAAAVVTLQLHEAGDRTRVTVDTDLKVVGKLAQFGSGMLQQVSEKLLGQFVRTGSQADRWRGRGRRTGDRGDPVGEHHPRRRAEDGADRRTRGH